MKIRGFARFATTYVPYTAVLATIGVLMIVTLTACGKKGAVRPKLDSLPQAPAEVTLQQRGHFFVLGWTIPTTNQDGSDVEDLVGFRIRRLGYDPADGCPTCREPQQEVSLIELKYPAQSQRIGDRIYWRDHDIQIPGGYRYSIAPVIIGNHEGPAAMVHLEAQQPPPSPTALSAEAGDSRVALQWTAPVLPTEMELVGYNLYRRQAKRPFPIVPVNSEPLQVTELLDRGLDNGRAYEYRVSAVFRSGDQLLESMASPGALVTPQ